MHTVAALSRTTQLTLAGLLVGVVGLIVQWIADPAKFGGAHRTFGLPFPPGIVFIVVFGIVSILTARWWWHPIFAVLISVWIVFGGLAAGKLQPNLVSSNIGTVLGNVVMCAGLAVAVVAGLCAMVHAVRLRPRQ